ncbi:MAG TPA: hypothetical protein VF230_14600 [Acidimicrobiales bacterium]
MRKLIACGVALSFLVFGGCGSGDGDGEAAGTVGEIDDKTIERHLTVDVTGAKTFHFDATAKMRILIREATGDKIAASVASISVPEMLPNGDVGLVMPEVGIATRYEGDGDYVVGRGTGQAPPGGPTAKEDPKVKPDVSLVQVTFITKQPPSETRYGYLLEHCEVTLKSDAQEGSAECPALVAINGEKVKLKLSWGAP